MELHHVKGVWGEGHLKVGLEGKGVGLGGPELGQGTRAQVRAGRWQTLGGLEARPIQVHGQNLPAIEA